jgi:hypothetical protein
MGKESHYSSKQDRIFVRGIQGQYSLKDELKRPARHAARDQGQGPDLSTTGRSRSASTSSSRSTA